MLVALHRRVTGCEPKMWGPSIIGYGSYDYTYDSGHGHVVPRRVQAAQGERDGLLNGGFGDRQGEADALFAQLGKHRTGGACLYLTRLDRSTWKCLRRWWSSAGTA